MERTLTVRAADGAQFELSLVGADTAKNGLLFLPALGVSARSCLKFARTLADRGVMTAVPDYRGLGSSDRRAGRRCDWGYRELLQYDIPAMVDALEQLPGATRWHLGGHSLGAQLAAVYLALRPNAAHGLVLIATGSPYWRAYPGARAWALRLLLASVPMVVRAFGYYPGKRLGFAGNEARTLMCDWARTGLTGSYRINDLNADIDAAMSSMGVPVFAAHLQHDTLTPVGALVYLMSKMPRCAVDRHELRAHEFSGGEATHFSWLRDGEPIAERISRWLERGAASAQ
jgi:predicted alpha/beta hydrolase